MHRRSLVLATAALLAMSLACSGVLGTPLEQVERTSGWRVEEATELAGRAPTAELSDEVEALNVSLREQLAALPTEPSAREAALGEFNQRSRAAIDDLESRIEAAHAAAGEQLRKDLVGRWEAPGVLLEITPGQVTWKDTRGSVSKELDVPLGEVGADYFKAGALGMYTTFEVDAAPHAVDGELRMTVDGTELRRTL